MADFYIPCTHASPQNVFFRKSDGKLVIATSASASWVSSVMNNGNFSSTSFWLPQYSSISANNNILTTTPDGAHSYSGFAQLSGSFMVPQIVGHKYYICTNLSIANLTGVSGATTDGFGYNAVASVSVANITAGVPFLLSGISGACTNSTDYRFIYLRASGSYVPSSAVISVYWCFAIDLTASELDTITAAQANALFVPHYSQLILGQSVKVSKP